MRTICKQFIVEGAGGPFEACIEKFLSVQHVGERTAVWAQVDTEGKREKWYVIAVPDGERMPYSSDNWVYIDTLLDYACDAYHYYGINLGKDGKNESTKT